MGEVFDILAGQLSSSERESLLEKIQNSTVFSSEPLLEREGPDVEIDLGSEYNRLGFVTKIIIFFQSLFQGKNKFELTEEHLTKRLIRGIVYQYPGVINEFDEKALPKFYTALKSLQTVSRAFFNPLQEALQTRQLEFIAFVTGFYYQILHQRISESIDPSLQMQDFAGKDVHEIHRIIKSNLDDQLIDISENDRQLLGTRFFTLAQLFKLASFPFEKVLDKFSGNSGSEVRFCSLDALKGDMLQLMSILINLSEPPESSSLYALFLFTMNDRAGQSYEQTGQQLDNQVERAKIALDTLREFNRTIPLIDIIKFTLKNINYFPEGEERGYPWFSMYKQYWEMQLDSKYQAFVTDRKHKQYIAEAAEFLGEHPFPLLPNYREGKFPKVFKPRYQYTIAFLSAFVLKTLTNRFRLQLQTIMIDGEFYKDHNRQEYTNAYNTLFQLPDLVKQIDSEFAPAGPIGEKLAAVKNEALKKSLKEKRIADLTADAETRIGKTVQSAVAAVSTLYDVVRGILYGEVGGKYDTLSNLSYLGGSDNKGFKTILDSLLSALHTCRDHLQNLTSMER